MQEKPNTRNNPFKFMSIHYQDLDETELHKMMTWLYDLMGTSEKGRIPIEQFNKSSRKNRLQIIKRLIDINSLNWDAEDITQTVSRSIREQIHRST